MYGVRRHVRMSNDTKSASETIQEVCPDITWQAIRDCVRLGSYTEGCNRPLLVKLNRSCDTLSILANRHKLLLSSTPVVFIKPHQSPHERSTEATLLCQRKLLIESGTDKKGIRIHGRSNCIFMKKKKYGSAFASTFKLHATVSLAANNHILDTAGTDDNSENTESNLSSATQGIVLFDDHDPPNNDQANTSD